MSSLVSAFNCISDNRAVSDLVNHIEESLNPQTKTFKNRIDFANDILTNRRKIKGEQKLIYNMTVWRKNDALDILNDISEMLLWYS